MKRGIPSFHLPLERSPIVYWFVMYRGHKAIIYEHGRVSYRIFFAWGELDLASTIPVNVGGGGGKVPRKLCLIQLLCG